MTPPASASVTVNHRPAAAKSATRATSTPKPRSAAWLIAFLLIFGALPLIFGALRVVQLSGGPELMPPDARFDAFPLPVLLHIAAAAVYALLAPFQFAPSLRRRNRWHRIAGRVLLLPAGLVVGLSGLWITLAWPGAAGGALLIAFRVVFASAMVAALILGFRAILRRDVSRHRAWMIRAYAIALGASTQMLTQMAGEAIAGPPDDLRRALLMGAAWVINLAVAEWVIRRSSPRPARLT